MKNKHFFILIALSTCLIYGNSLRYGFSQDDWYFLSISQAHNLGEIINFFNPTKQAGFAFFRPLGTQLYYYLAVALAGLRYAPYFMHLFMLTLQVWSAVLVYKLLHALKYNDPLAKCVAFLYATTSTVFLSLYYIAATQQLLATFFSLVSLTSFIKQKKLATGFYWSLALLSKETAIIVPVIAFLLSVISNVGHKLSINLRRYAPYFFVGMAYLLLRWLSPHTVQTEYHFMFGGNVLSTMRWFLFFGYGSPEEWLRYGLSRGGLDVSSLLHSHGLLGLTNLTATFILLFLAIKSFLLMRHHAKPYIYLAWFIAGLLPILFLQNHRYPHYLDLSLIPLLLLSLEPMKKLRLIIVALLLISSLSAIYISVTSHWTVARANISYRAINYFANNHLCDYPHLIFSAPAPYPAELSYALSLENGPRVICNNPSLKVEYIEQVMDQGDALIVDPRLLL